MNISKYNNNFNISGKIIKKRRLELNISQEQLANKLNLLGVNIYYNDIYMIENNKRTVKDFELIAICKVLNINIEDMKKIIKS